MRFFALFRKKGALGQLGWAAPNLSSLLLSGKQAVPWMNYGAIDFIDQTLSPELTVLELGGGSSTLYWATRGNAVTTLENSVQWKNRIDKHLREFDNYKCYLVNNFSQEQLNKLQLKTFDVIQIDHDGGNRSEVVGWVVERLNENGVIIWDNTDRQDAVEGVLQLTNQGFGHLSFFGLGPYNAYASQTSFFSKSIASPSWNTLERSIIRY